jgi:hypothetical protein
MEEGKNLNAVILPGKMTAYFAFFMQVTIHFCLRTATAFHLPIGGEAVARH